MPDLEERVESLETLLGRFILHTDMSLKRTDMSLNRLSKEVDRVSNKVDKLSDEMRAFKDEMRAFKDEMLAFKEEMRAFKDEMLAFKDEMRAFKDEMLAFKEEARQERIEMNKRWGEITNKLGTFAEDMVAPNIKGIAKKYFGCEDLEDFMVRRTRRHSKDKTKRREFDVIAVCDDLVIVNETKSTARINYIDEFITVLKEFYDYFPEYKDKKVIPVFASLYLGDDMVNYLTKNKIYAMAIKEDTMDILNFEAVK